MLEMYLFYVRTLKKESKNSFKNHNGPRPMQCRHDKQIGLKVPIESETKENFSEEGRLFSMENKTGGRGKHFTVPQECSSKYFF